VGDVLSQKFRKLPVVASEEYTRLGIRWYAEGPFKKESVFGKEVKGPLTLPDCRLAVSEAHQ